MASGTIIDSLMVLLGLNPEGYKKGAEEVGKIDDAMAAKRKSGGEKEAKTEKEAAARRKSEAKAREKEAQQVTKSLEELGRSVAVLFLGFEGVTGLAKWLGGLNEGEAQLGRTSANIGMSAHELNKWGNAVQLAGGKAEDAQDAFKKVTDEFTQQHVTGQTGPLLTFLRARGVAVADANGRLRNQGEILEELADKTAQYGRVYQANMFRQAGLNEGEINYLVQASALRREQLALAEENNQVSDDSVRKAQALQQQWNQVKEQITAAGQALLITLTPAVSGLLVELSNVLGVVKAITNSGPWNAIDNFLKTSWIGKVISFLVDPLGNIMNWVNSKGSAAPAAAGGKETFASIWDDFKKGLGNSVKYANQQYGASVDPVQKQQLLQTIAATEASLGIPAGLLANIAQQESGFRKDVISGKTRSSAGAVGLMQLMPNYFPGAGQSPERDIATAGKELKRLYSVFGDWNKAIAAYNDGEGNIKKVLAGKKSLPEETRRYVAAVGATPSLHGGSGGATGGGNTITVDADITVNSSNADATQVANAAAGALVRKMTTAQAFQGQN